MEDSVCALYLNTTPRWLKHFTILEIPPGRGEEDNRGTEE